MIICKTPLRMSFVGGGSDIPAYYRQEGGAVLSTAINKYMYIAVNKKFDEKIRLSYSVTETVNSVEKLNHPIVRNSLELLNIKGGVEIVSVADIPSKGSGLGSSSAYAVGLLHALYTYKGEMISKDRLGELASYVEIELCGDKIGKQDQYASAFGGLNFIRFHEDDSVSVDKIVCTQETIKKMEKSILVFYTGRTRSAASLLSEQSNNMGNSVKRKLMKEMVSLTYDMKALLESNNLDSIGELLDKNWRLKQQMASGISDPEINNWYSRGINAGASGGKLLGAGNGGFIMFFAPFERHEAIIKAMKGLKKISISFDLKGSQIVLNQTNNLKKYGI